MSLVTCKECGEQISAKATACPKCGHPVPKPAGVLAYLFWGFVGLTVIMVVVAKNNPAPDSPAAKPTQASIELQKRKSAVTACRLAIKRSMRDPESAEFKETREDTIFVAAPGGYRLFPTVRGTNAFGAHIQTTFDCTVAQGSAPDTWRIVSLTER